MNLNRRQTMLALGSIAIGGGAVASSGAFSQTQVTRDLSLTISNDAEALLTLEPTDEENDKDNTDRLVRTVGDNNEIIELDFGIDGAGVNVDGVTLFDNVLEVTNNTDGDATILLATGEDDDDRLARSRVIDQETGKDITKPDGFYSGGVDTDDFRFINGVPDDGAITLDRDDTATLDFEFETRENTRSEEFLFDKRFKAFDDAGDVDDGDFVDEDLDEELV